MHDLVEGDVDSWLNALQQDPRQEPFGGFVFLWFAFNQLYNFHCYDMHSPCVLGHKMALDLMPRRIRSSPSDQALYCGYGEKGHRNVAEWGRITCVVRFLPENVRDELLRADEVNFFLSRRAFSPRSGRWSVPRAGVLNIHRTKAESPQELLYTLGFVSACQRYQSNEIDSCEAIQHLAYLLYTIRCNLMHGGKTYRSENSRDVVAHAVPLLRKIVITLQRMDCQDFEQVLCDQ